MKCAELMRISSAIAIFSPIVAVVGLCHAGLQAREPQSLGAVGVSRGSQQGITITRLIPGGPAQLAGLAVGDVITAISGKQVKQVAEEGELMSSKPAGAHVSVDYMRGAQKAQAQLVLGMIEPNPPPTTQANPVTIFGITTGKPLPNFPQCHLWGADGFADEQPCKWPGSDFLRIASSEATVVKPQLLDGNVENLWAVWEDYHCPRARSALEDKFGKPAMETTEKVRTGAGVEVDQVHTVWKQKNVSMMFSSPGTKVNDCTLDLITDEWIKIGKRNQNPSF